MRNKFANQLLGEIFAEGFERDGLEKAWLAAGWTAYVGAQGK